MRHTRNLRRGSSEEKKSLQQLVLSILGIISLLFLFFYLGIPLLVKLSGFIAGFKKETAPTQNETNIVSEPFLDPLPTATNSAQIQVSGSANPGDDVILFVNDSKSGDKIVGKDGLFSFNNVSLDEGINEIYAQAKAGSKESSPSIKVKIVYKNNPPKLEIESPKNGDVFKREQREIDIKGITDEEVTVSINDRLIIVEPNGNFSSTYRLIDGENKIEVKATDSAGNTQTVEIKVTYEP